MDRIEGWFDRHAAEPEAFLEYAREMLWAEPEAQGFLADVEHRWGEGAASGDQNFAFPEAFADLRYTNRHYMLDGLDRVYLGRVREQGETVSQEQRRAFLDRFREAETVRDVVEVFDTELSHLDAAFKNDSVAASFQGLETVDKDRAAAILTEAGFSHMSEPQRVAARAQTQAAESAQVSPMVQALEAQARSEEVASYLEDLYERLPEGKINIIDVTKCRDYGLTGEERKVLDVIKAQHKRPSPFARVATGDELGHGKSEDLSVTEEAKRSV